MNWVFVFIGGGLGSVARFGLSHLFLRYLDGELPVATFFSNLLSCAILAMIIGAYGNSGLDNRLLRTAVIIGFCGGFSTFSTFSYETVVLIKNGNHLVAVGNVILSVTVCLILIYKLTK